MLSDPSKRKDYDNERALGSSKPAEFSFTNAFDIFKDFFGDRDPFADFFDDDIFGFGRKRNQKKNRKQQKFGSIFDLPSFTVKFAETPGSKSVLSETVVKNGKTFTKTTTTTIDA